MLFVTVVLATPAWVAVVGESEECGGVELGMSWLEMEDGVVEGGTLFGVEDGVLVPV
jgi:hypothetical protein